MPVGSRRDRVADDGSIDERERAGTRDRAEQHAAASNGVAVVVTRFGDSHVRVSRDATATFRHSGPATGVARRSQLCPPSISSRDRFTLSVAVNGVGNSYIPLGPVPSGVSAGYAPAEVPLYRDREAVETGYATAEREETPFFAVEHYEEGFAVTYDLLPAGAELSEPALAELEERITREVEAVVADDAAPTTEVTRSVGNSLGQFSFFTREETARQIAATVSVVVLDEANWVTATSPDDAGAAYRQN
jgi:hypothetical protein